MVVNLKKQRASSAAPNTSEGPYNSSAFHTSVPLNFGPAAFSGAGCNPHCRSCSTIVPNISVGKCRNNPQHIGTSGKGFRTSGSGGAFMISYTRVLKVIESVISGTVVISDIHRPEV